MTERLSDLAVGDSFRIRINTRGRLTSKSGHVVFIRDDKKIFDANIQVYDVSGVEIAEELPQHDRTHLVVNAEEKRDD